MTTQRCLVDECRFVTINEFCAVHRPTEEADECASCGDMRHMKDGEVIQHGVVHAAAIDPPWFEFVCSSCISLAEDAQLDRQMERAAERMSDEGW